MSASLTWTLNRKCQPCVNIPINSYVSISPSVVIWIKNSQVVSDIWILGLCDGTVCEAWMHADLLGAGFEIENPHLRPVCSLCFMLAIKMWALSFLLQPSCLTFAAMLPYMMGSHSSDNIGSNWLCILCVALCFITTTEKSLIHQVKVLLLLPIMFWRACK